MSDAPERMWVYRDIGHGWGCDDYKPLSEAAVEYTRADTIPRWSTDIDAAREHVRGGGRVLLWGAGYVEVPAECEALGGGWFCALTRKRFERPTHWMPITPPEGE